MKARGIKPRIPWEDRFQTPRTEDLLSEFAKHQAHLIHQAREALNSMDGVTESIAWLGIPWRWTLAFGLDGVKDKPWAYLVPQPGKPILALPMTGEAVASLPMRKLPKFIRDVVTLSPKVGGVHWMQWELTSKTQLDELITLARKKHELLLSPTA
jgi:hypothetical protein